MNVRSLVEAYSQKIIEAGHAGLHSKALELDNEYNQQILKLNNPVDEITAELEEMVTASHRDNANLWLWAAILQPSTQYLKPLCELIEQEDIYIWHEGIMEVFLELKDERTVPSLKKAITHRLISDPALQVPKRAMEVLATIGTPKALEVLRECLASPSEIIREEAEIYLEP